MLIQKNIEDVDINDDVINVYFSESETLKLTTEKCKLQARFNINSNIVASDIIYFSPKALIKDEVMLNES